ncbi:MAG TPA: hypothetical protein VK447_19590, partial [Myxococcaceae bacterium]|nr:hypothetical protein [Myxococcaceae bacterium]
MLFGDDKPRHMARSILPSKSREVARAAKRAVKRGARRNIRHAMNEILRDPELFDETAGLGDYPEHEVRWVVRDRRASDKLNHFIRWAEKVTEDLPAQDRLSHIRAKVPEGVIGEHALLHLSHREAFESPQERELREAARRAWANRWRLKLMDRGEMAVLLREV